MATKKLKVEVELDTEKAKRQAQQIAGGTAGSSVATSVPRSTDEMSRALERATRSASKFGDEASKSAGNMTGLVRSFAGMAIGLSASYAARYMKQGTARDAVEYGGAVLSGASAGAVAGMPAGPVGSAVGAVAGAIGGAAKTALEKNSDISKAQESFSKSNDDYEENRLWQKRMRDLTDVEEAPVGMSKEDANADQQKKIDDKILQAKKRSDGLFDEQNRLVEQINSLLRQGKTEDAAELQEKLSTVRVRREQVEALERAFAKQKKSLEREEEEIKNGNKTIRTSTTGTDALSKVGGIMVGSAETSSATDSTPSDQPPESSPSVKRSFGFSVPSSKVATMTFGSTKPVGEYDQAIKTATEMTAREQKEMIDILRGISQKIGGGDSWQ